LYECGIKIRRDRIANPRDDLATVLAKVASDPSLIPGGIDEVLRVATPVIYMRRTATKDTQLAGTQIKKGDKVIT